MHLLHRDMDIPSRYGLVPRRIGQGDLPAWIARDPETRNFVHRHRGIETGQRDPTAPMQSLMSVATYMCPRSPATRLELLHSTGTGKTRKSLVAAMQYGRDITVIAVHSRQIQAFTSELAPGTMLAKLFPAFNKRVDVMTCRAISVAARRRDTARLDHMFRGRVIIVDEVHHIRKGDEPQADDALFETIAAMLAKYTDAIVLALTATPLVDRASELRGMYTLLRGEPPGAWNPEYIAAMLRGYVSVLRTQNWPSTDHTVTCRMASDGPQWQAFQLFREDKSSVHSKTGAVSRFVTQCDAHASECMDSTQDLVDEMLETWHREGELQRILGLRGKVPWPLPPEHYGEAVLQCIKRLGIKYYRLLRHVLEHRGYPKFIYDSWRKRGGIDRLVDVLSLPAIGFTSVTTEAEVYSAHIGPRMLVLHRLPARSNSSVGARMLELFNSEANADGSLIELMLATPKFAENMSVKTARECHVITPPWNLTTRTQITGRVNRRSSLWYLPPAQRVLRNYDYVLEEPDGAETFEAGILRTCREKDREIRPLLQVLADVRIEDLCTLPPSQTLSLDLWGPASLAFSALNRRVRFARSPVNQRNIATDVSPFLAELERSPSLFDLLVAASEADLGYTKHVSIVVRTLETLYHRRQRGDALSDKQQRALADMDQVFMQLGQRYTVHVMYSLSLDTVEYQRLASSSERIVRVYNAIDGHWEDLEDQRLCNNVNRAYDDIAATFARSVEARWREAGHYVVRYTLPPCYRLVEYKSAAALSNRNLSGVDRRKVSRGEKWQYYPKPRVAEIIARMRGSTASVDPRMARRLDPGYLLDTLLDAAKSQGLYLELPI